MSIDAKCFVYFDENGGGRLELLGDERGQRRLRFDKAPEEVSALNGRHVWGGSSEIMLGNRKIATRVGYTKIEFVSRAEFIYAIGESNRR